ncbi:heat shock protein transcriptional repressor HspR [Actinomyces vulturis]|uniref:heat shock protein transcriptional repressor HspR n=1 Tax=Actinomyces vulturis TaxID=1857645 RepID=UPI000836123F|nr:helix-turn-helix transcriptional regulator [Actinomyces vulturis]
MKHTSQGIGSVAEDALYRPVYVISVAASLAGMHPQTLRQYDRLGLVIPARTQGRGRRYSLYDVQRLRQIQTLSNEGINLAGIRRIIELERQVEVLSKENILLQARQEAVQRVFAAATDGQVYVLADSRRAMQFESDVD